MTEIDKAYKEWSSICRILNRKEDPTIYSHKELLDFAKAYHKHMMQNFKSPRYSFSDYPLELEPVLAKIEHINELGKSTWYEVVYYSDKSWKSYASSNTFQDGEKVVNWRYCKD